MNWYFQVLKKYTEFKGRARRQEYWYFAIFNIIASIILVVIDVGTGNFNEEVGFGLLSGIYTLGILLPGIAVSIRRLHDTNRSGWWLLISLVPIIGSIVLLVFMIQAGTSGENQYGSDPKLNEPTTLTTARTANATLRSNDKFAQLEKLKKLLDDGILTEEEFKTEKQKIL